MHGDAVKVLSSVFITIQSDTIDYSIRDFHKISLELLLFEWGSFFDRPVYKDIYFLRRITVQDKIFDTK